MSKKRTQFSKVKYQFISPFGPSVLIGKMPDVILDEFEKIIDNVIEAQNKNHGKGLAGRIDDEWTIDEGKLKYGNLGDFLDNIVVKYVSEVAKRSINTNNFAMKSGFEEKNQVELDIGVDVVRMSSWVNSMKSGEYNPFHYHPECNLTTVFFFDDLDEDFIDDIIAPTQTDSFLLGDDVHKQGTTEDGLLHIIYNSNQYFELGQFQYRPKRGTFLIFPASLLHGVYPFISEKRRRSASINYRVKSNFDGCNFGVR